jgi:Cof subfamily protein (haloacid dehalogenase superfamily)
MTIVNDSNEFPFRLAAIDLDGTLLGPDKKISSANIEAVHRLRDAGVQVIIAPGRRHQNSLRFHQELHLNGPIIACQGGLIRNGETGEILYARFLPEQIADQLAGEGDSLGLDVIYYHLEHLYVGAPHSRWLDLYRARVGEKPDLLPDLHLLAGQGALKIVWYAEASKLAILRAEMTARYAGRCDVLSTEMENLEFMPIGVNKATALARIADELRIKPEAVLAFGDGENDVAMLRWAGLGVAMSNGNAVAKAAAKLVPPEGPAESDFARAVELVFQRARNQD